MPQPLGGAGVPLPQAQLLYPPGLMSVPPGIASYAVALPAGQNFVVPAGNWTVSWDASCMLQWYDGNATGQWINANAVFPIGLGSDAAGVGAGANAVGSGVYLKSDGINYRIANLTTMAWAARVTAAGTGYVQSSTTVTASAGNSSWMPIVGGNLAASGTVVTGGAGYTKAPYVLVPPPPSPGVPATIIATISGGAVNALTVIRQGAGYLTAPRLVILPDPTDPAFLSGAITSQATGTVALNATQGTITAVLLQNFGTPQATMPTLTVNGAGASATVVTVPASAVASATASIILQPAP